MRQLTPSIRAFELHYAVRHEARAQALPDAVLHVETFDATALGKDAKALTAQL
jgi:hypothetical protein